MIKVYNPYPVDYVRDWFDFYSKEFVSSTDQDEVLAQPLKIACLPAFFTYNPAPEYIRYFDFDLLLFSDIEFNTTGTIDRWLKGLEFRKNTKYLMAVGGLEYYSVFGNTIYRPWWSFNLVSKNTYQDVDSADKPFVFDCLLGARKPHRDLVMSLMQTQNMLGNSIVNYRDVFNAPTQVDESLRAATELILQDQKLCYPYVSPNLDPAWEVQEQVTYSVSDIVPWEIYRQTRYSIISETLYHNGSFFFSEKTTKAMFGKRLFLIFSCAGFLTRLRSLGFKTFDNVIDESYDLEPNDARRFNMAFQQAKKLSRMDYKQVQELTAEARQHNFERLYSLREELKAEMQEMVYNKIKEIKNANSIQ